jgi:hypothetical protein
MRLATGIAAVELRGQMEFWKTLIEKWPRMTVYALVIYAVGYSALYAYESYRKNIYEAEKPYIQGLYDECLNASELSAKISTAPNYSEDDIRDFWTLYYGKLVIFENDAVAKSMAEFGDALNETTFGEDNEKLRTKSLTIAGACRDLIRDTWNLSISPWQSLDVKVKPICTSPKC